MPIRAERKNPPRKASTPAPAEPAPPLESPPVVGIETLWPAVLERVRDGEGGEMLAALLADARPAGLENDVLVLMYPQSASFSKRKIEDAANGERLVQALKLVAGRPLGVRIELRDLEADEDAGEDAGEEDMIERIKNTFDAEDLSEDPAPEDVPERSA
jgi:DNA polymerase III subunit tau-like protein